jgi:hypothetical protein
MCHTLTKLNIISTLWVCHLRTDDVTTTVVQNNNHLNITSDLDVNGQGQYLHACQDEAVESRIFQIPKCEISHKTSRSINNLAQANFLEKSYIFTQICGSLESKSFVCLHRPERTQN